MQQYFLFFLFIYIFPYFTIGQYISNVTIPDNSSPIITDSNLPQVKFAQHITSKVLSEHLHILAADNMEGRETGQPGNDMAGEYIANQLKEYGLKMIPNTNSYKQPVAFTFSKWSNNELFVNGEKYKHLWDYLVFPTQNNGDKINVEDVIFLGYGIDDRRYSDYKGKNVEGKVIMINRGEPTKNDSISLLTNSNIHSSWSEDNMDQKLRTAKANGVKAVLIIENDIKKLLEKNRRKLLGSFLELGDMSNRIYDYPTQIYISGNIAKNIIGTNDKKLIKARKRIAKGKAKSLDMKTNLFINLEKETNLLLGNNIFGLIEGETKKDEYIVVSAHYDHLGKRGDDIFNGADDNGSGSSALLNLAQTFQKSKNEGYGPQRSIIFLWVTGEEKGLLGSNYYTQFPIIPLENTMANVNVDMIGRVDEKYGDNENYTYVIGSDRLSTDLHKVNEEVNQKFCQLTLDYTYNAEDDPNQYYFRSDHYNFAKNGIPAIFFFSGVHKDYHRPSDTVEKINFEKMTGITKLIFHTIWELSNRREKIIVDGIVK